MFLQYVPLMNMGYKHTGTLVMCKDSSKECYVGKPGDENPSTRSEMLQLLGDLANAAYVLIVFVLFILFILFLC